MTDADILNVLIVWGGLIVLAAVILVYCELTDRLK